MLDGDPSPDEFERDVPGSVAFYSADEEVIRYVLASSPRLPPCPSRRPMLGDASHAAFAPPPLLASALVSPSLPAPSSSGLVIAPAAPPPRPSPGVPSSSLPPPPGFLSLSAEVLAIT